MVEEDKWGDCEEINGAEIDAWEMAEKDLGLKAEKSLPISISFSVLSQEQVEEKLKGLIQDCIDLFTINSDEATIVLMNYEWNWAKLQNDWFNKESEIRKKCGIPSVPSKEKLGEQCPVCFEDINPKSADFLKCNHAFCSSCWKGHLQAQVSLGKACLLAKCPFPKCNLRVGPSFFKKHLAKSDYAKFYKFLIAGFTEDNKTMKCCPSAGCEMIVENTGPTVTEVTCKCDYVFCFACHSEGHMPANCDTNKKWNDKNS